MAYSAATLPVLVVQPMAGIRTWFHTSADATAAADVAGFITNGQDLGMKVGDIVFHKDSTTDATALTSHKVIALSAVNRSVDLSDGTVIGSATNTD
jgi:hypothetical protein